MDTLIDDVGSFPLPASVDRHAYEASHRLARRAIAQGKDILKDKHLKSDFCDVVVDSFKKKLESGLDVTNYPQHCDMHRQFADVISEATDRGTYVVDVKNAVIPEVYVIGKEAKRLCEETGHRIRLRVCITGPMELYLKEIGTTPHRDVLLMLAETARRFAKNAMLNNKYIKTEVVSLDEPSFGFQEVTAERDVVVEVLEKALGFSGAVRQVHLHSSTRITDLLDVEGLEVLAFEYAASPKNLESLSRSMLERADKRLRVGIARTDIDAIVAELCESGVTEPSVDMLVENVAAIRKRFRIAKAKFGDCMVFAGPDCGLGSWPTQEAAQLVLNRTVCAVKCHGDQ